MEMVQNESGEPSLSIFNTSDRKYSKEKKGYEYTLKKIEPSGETKRSTFVIVSLPLDNITGSNEAAAIGANKDEIKKDLGIDDDLLERLRTYVRLNGLDGVKNLK